MWRRAHSSAEVDWLDPAVCGVRRIHADSLRFSGECRSLAPVRGAGSIVPTAQPSPSWIGPCQYDAASQLVSRYPAGTQDRRQRELLLGYVLGVGQVTALTHEGPALDEQPALVAGLRRLMQILLASAIPG